MEEIHPEHVWSGNTTTHAYDESMIADDTSINILYPNHECFAILNIFLFKQAAVRAMDTIQNFVKAKSESESEIRLTNFSLPVPQRQVVCIYNVDVFNLWEHTFYCNQLNENDDDFDFRNCDDDDEDDELFLFDREGGQRGQQRLSTKEWLPWHP